MRYKLLTTAAGLAAALPAQAGVVYSNNFDGENGGNTALNYTGFSGLTVTSGTVDLVHTGDGFNITCRGGAGGCVDLDGSTQASGALSSGSYGYAANDGVSLGLSLSGSQVAGYGTSGVQFGFLFDAPTSATYSFTLNGTFLFGGAFNNEMQFQAFGTGIPFDAPFDDIVFTVRPTTAGTLSFYINGSSPSPTDSNNDNVGMILDNVSLSVGVVPEPATWAMMIGGFGLVGGTLRRRRTTVAFA